MSKYLFFYLKATKFATVKHNSQLSSISIALSKSPKTLSMPYLNTTSKLSDSNFPTQT